MRGSVSEPVDVRTAARDRVVHRDVVVGDEAEHVIAARIDVVLHVADDDDVVLGRDRRAVR